MWTAITGWFAQNPIAKWIAAVFVFLIGWEVVKRHIREAAKKAERDAIAAKQAQVKEAVVERRAEIITEERQNADAALDARDSAEHYPTYDSLPDDLKRIANGNQGSGGGS